MNHHSHECRDCGHSIPCDGAEDRHGACLRWDGGNDGCTECNGPMTARPRFRSEPITAAQAHAEFHPETVNIEPDYDRLREWMLRVWADPTQVAFRGAILADPGMLAWLNPPQPAPYRPSRPGR